MGIKTICKLCNQEKKLIKAHIIPEAFYREYGMDEIYSNKPDPACGKYTTKRAPKGVYDQNILCEECERLFYAGDDYAVNIFIKKFDEIFKFDAGANCYFAKEYDYEKLIMFVQGLLWRAYVSGNKFFNQIVIKKDCELKIYESILNRTITNNFVAPIFFIQRYPASLSPNHQLIDGLDWYTFYLGNVGCMVKVSEKNSEGCLNSKNEDLIIFCPGHDFSGDKAIKEIFDINYKSK